MTPADICATVVIVGLVACGIYRLIMWAASKAIDGLSEMVTFDDRMRYQKRASTEREPSEAEALLSIALIVLAAVALGWLWLGNSVETIQCVLAYLAGHAH